MKTKKVLRHRNTFDLLLTVTSVVYRKNISHRQVAIISGGGSGHEPAHAGFVGDGLLSAAVCGNVFASPNVAQIRRGIELVGSETG